MNNRLYASMREIEFCSVPGSRYRPVYDVKVLDDGQLELRVVEQRDTVELMNAQRPSTDLHFILARFANGDTSVLNRWTPVYADVSNYPKNFADVMQTVINAENAFSALPVKIKNEFGNDWRKWLASAGSEEWQKSMSPVFAPADAASAAEKSDGAAEKSDSPSP